MKHRSLEATNGIFERLAHSLALIRTQKKHSTRRWGKLEITFLRDERDLVCDIPTAVENCASRHHTILRSPFDELKKSSLDWIITICRLKAAFWLAAKWVNHPKRRHKLHTRLSSDILLLSFLSHVITSTIIKKDFFNKYLIDLTWPMMDGMKWN